MNKYFWVGGIYHFYQISSTVLELRGLINFEKYKINFSSEDGPGKKE